MRYNYLVVDYANPNDLTDVVSVDYRLRHYPIVDRWIKLVEAANAQYPIDNPARFYGFGSPEHEAKLAVSAINQNIRTINQYQNLVGTELTSVDDQDTLNYLHNVFERYHGLLDKQDTDFWNLAPNDVKQALADLNVNVHRCESVARGNPKRQVTTWYGLPKTETLDKYEYDLFTDTYRSGTVYLNYVEIGKTFEELAYDNDQYIGDDAFRPFRHFSADFTVKFHSTGEQEFANKSENMLQYYLQNVDFFAARGLTFDHPYMRPGLIPVADGGSGVADAISNHLYVKKVSFK